MLLPLAKNPVDPPQFLATPHPATTTTIVVINADMLPAGEQRQSCIESCMYFVALLNRCTHSSQPNVIRRGIRSSSSSDGSIRVDAICCTQPTLDYIKCWLSQCNRKRLPFVPNLQHNLRTLGLRPHIQDTLKNAENTERANVGAMFRACRAVFLIFPYRMSRSVSACRFLRNFELYAFACVCRCVVR